MHSRKTQRPPSAKLNFDFRSAPTGPIRWRLMLLVGVLLFVLVMMRFAGDPKNWAWMGFDKVPAKANHSVAPTTESPPSADVRLAAMNRETTLDDVMDESKVGLLLPEGQPSLAGLRLDFWTRLVRRLDGPSRQALYAMVWESEFNKRAATLASRENLVSRINEFNEQFSTELLSQSSELTRADAERRRLWADTLFQWQNEWREETNPALTHLSTVDDQTTVDGPTSESLREILSVVASALVVDDTLLGRPIEIPYWNLLVAKVATEAPPAFSTSSVTLAELRNEPKSFRGSRVIVSGTILRAREQASGGQINGVDRYYELWLQADDASTIPCCIYVLELPAGFPNLDDHLREFDLPAKVVGYFFKNRSYLIEGPKTQFCPVVLARRPEVKFPPPESARFQPPSPSAFAGLLAGISLLALWIAFRVYRATVFARRVPSRSIPATLVELENDPRIETVRDRLAKWGGQVETSSPSKENRSVE